MANYAKSGENSPNSNVPTVVGKEIVVMVIGTGLIVGVCLAIIFS